MDYDPLLKLGRTAKKVVDNVNGIAEEIF